MENAIALPWIGPNCVIVAAGVRTALKQRPAATTVNKMLALRRVLLAYRLDLLEMIDYSNRFCVKASGELRGRALSELEVNSLIESCLSKERPSTCGMQL